jgi:hypothetical protein
MPHDTLMALLLLGELVWNLDTALPANDAELSERRLYLIKLSLDTSRYFASWYSVRPTAQFDL